MPASVSASLKLMAVYCWLPASEWWTSPVEVNRLL